MIKSLNFYKDLLKLNFRNGNQVHLYIILEYLIIKLKIIIFINYLIN